MKMLSMKSYPFCLGLNVFTLNMPWCLMGSSHTFKKYVWFVVEVIDNAKENLSVYVTSIVAAYGLAPFGARTSAGT